MNISTMKKIYILFILIIFTGLFTEKSWAQQDPQFTQYMYNLSAVNPAYAGSKEHLSIGVIYRNQWTGFDGAPTTGNFFGHLPVGKNVGLGLSAITDEIGPLTETNVYGDFSYTVRFNDVHKLAFGLKAGVTFHNAGLADLTLQDFEDPAFSTNSSETLPNFGAGVFFYSDHYYLSLSIPNFIQGTFLDVNGVSFGNEVSHFFITGGYVFTLSEAVKLKPSFLVKTSFNAPLSYDLNLNARFLDRFEIGASYRLDDSFSGLVNVQVLPWLHAGFAYDRITSDIQAVADSSFEGFLIFDIFPGSRPLRSPRFF